LKLPPCAKVNLEKGFEVFTRTFKVYKVIGICKGCGPKSLTLKVIDEGTFWQYRGPYADLINIRPIAGTCS
jgi:hypothetical protein